MKRAISLFLLVASCREQLAGNLSEKSATQSMVFLSRAGISAQQEKIQGQYSLFVSRAEAPIARRLLQENHLPKTSPDCTPKSMFPSPQEESEAKRACLAYQLAEHIEQLDGVVSAEVILPVSSTSEWPLKESPITSLSLLYTYQEKPLPEERLRDVLGASLPDKPEISIIGRPLSIKSNPWVSVGPFAVAPESERSLFFSLLALVTFGVGALFACLSLWLRQRRLRRPVNVETGT